VTSDEHPPEEDKHSLRRVAALDEILLQEIPVLDHGFVRVIDYMGSDDAVVQAARVSYGRGTKRVSEDRALIRYLLRNSHTSPFEMAEIKLHVKLPIFVARQWIRHRTASVNEYSARYSILDNEFYVSEPRHLAPQSKLNRQGRSDELDADEARAALQTLLSESQRSYGTYRTLLNRDEQNVEIDSSRKGLARELGRLALSVNFYTQWYWKIDANNLLHFIKLRADAHAQYEIRAYANVLIDILRRWLPLTFEAFVDYRLNAFCLSGPAVDVVRLLLTGAKIKQESSGLSRTEWEELMTLLYPPQGGAAGTES
jgi:thymidylate synthase (FAD)